VRHLGLLLVSLLVVLPGGAIASGPLFLAGQSFQANEFPFGVAAADLNGDGKQDLVVSNDLSADVSVMLGNGDGTFQPAVNFPVGDFPYAIELGDLNHDGRLDAVTANSSNISVILGNGDGTFQGHTDYPVVYANGIAIGDLNGDGDPDLATANVTSGTASVFTGNGDGTFQPKVDYATGASVFSTSRSGI